MPAEMEDAMDEIAGQYDNTEVNAVLANVDVAQMTQACEGRNGLRTSKPDADGLTQYVWRMARFHSGDDASMPVTASWWLQDWIDSQGIDASVSGIMDDDGKAVTSALNDVVAVILSVGYNRSPNGAAERWDGLAY